MNIRNCFSVCALAIFLFSSVCSAHDGDDKRPLEHKDYDRWNSVSGTSLSNDGKWIAYTIRPGKGDATLKIHNPLTEKEFTIVRGSGLRFSDDSTWAIYRISPDPKIVKKLQKDKKPASQLPTDLIEVLHLESGRHTTIPRARSFSMPEKNGDWMAYLELKPLDPPTVKQEKSNVTEAYQITPEGLQRSTGQQPKPPAGQTSEEKKSATKKPTVKTTAKNSAAEEGQKSDTSKKPASKKKKAAGTTLVLRHLKSGVERAFPNVVSFRFSKNGKRLAFATSTEKDPDGDGVTVINLEKQTDAQIVKGLGNYRNLVFNEDGSQLAFLTDRDDYAAEKSSWSLFHYRSGQKQATKIAAEETKGIPKNWWISSTAAPAFTEDGRRLLFSTAPKPEDLNQKKDADKDEEPKAKLDLWHWQDPFLQPQQLLQAAQERNRSYRALYDLRSKKIIQLATKEMPTVTVDPRRKSDITLGISNLKYRKQMSWESPRRQDVYTVSLGNGTSTLLLEGARSFPSLSPEGKFVTWWDPEKRHWFASPTAKPNPVAISSQIKVPLFNELHDTPSLAGAYGNAGWLKGDSAFLIYDRFDIWQLDPTGKTPPINLTQGMGHKTQTRFRVLKLDREARAIDNAQPMILSAFEHKTKASGFYRLNPMVSQSERTAPEKLLMLDESVGGMQKAKNSDAVVFTRQSFVRSPDLWYSSTDLKHISRVSRANPQQHEYTWGTAELVHWKATDGKPLDGILYKPDGFDASKKYPLMVYFYEKNSDNLHRYNAPAAGRSTINFSFYVSRGYLLFIPDIPYKTGYPGQSAANSILPGVESLVAQGFVDKERIGMQGHSWGGYQTAYLVTQTDMFACAESGAPVSNMTSAYGGIRWSSGMSRMFQYERTQSRIGKPLWQARDLYLENSPVFFADKINTPLLILHNDQDGAVPWYQGIEMFVAMRRLGKPAWLMNYNGEPHWVMKPENRIDFAKRMQTFFDHYLKGDPMPEWMANGIPAVDKGKKFGFEPAKESSEQPAAEKK